jgi:hypothetical protein
MFIVQATVLDQPNDTALLLLLESKINQLVMISIKTQFNPKIIEAYYACSNFGDFMKNRFGVCGMQPSALAASGSGGMQH